MRIGITLLSHDESWGGPGVLTRELVRNLLEVDRENEYILIYPNFGGARLGFGQYAKHSNVTEVRSEGWRLPISECWEQIGVPRLAKRYGVDCFFGPCMAVPVAGRYRKVMLIPGIEF